MTEQPPAARRRRTDHDRERQAQRAGESDRALHRRRRHRPRHLARVRARARRGRREGLRRQAQDPLDGSARRREGVQPDRQLAARRNRRGVPQVSRLDQGPADDAGRRRHPLAQRRAAPDARSLLLPAPGALVQGRALAGQGSVEGRHDDLPREHRGHLRRHRIPGRHRRREEVRGAAQGELPGALQESALSRTRRASASSRSRAKAPSASCARR